jgi:outer membrane protein TolC
MRFNAGWRIALAAIAFLATGPGRAGATPLTLSEAIDRALAFAPSVSMVAAESEVSRARTREQRAPLFPTFSAGVEYYQAPGYNTTVTNRGLSAGLVAQITRRGIGAAGKRNIARHATLARPRNSGSRPLAPR